MTQEPNEEPVILREVTGPVAVLTLNRPKARNALDDGMRETLRQELESLSAEPDVRVIVLTGAGSAFCAGGDIKGMRQRLEQPPGQVAYRGWRRQQQTGAFIATLANLGQVTIAAVNGPAMGLGLDVALACDFIVAAPEAQFAASFVKRGLVPDGGGLYTLPRRIGLQLTKELIYSGRTVGAEEALRIHLADRLAGPGKLLEDTRAFAAQFTENSRSAIALMKSVVNRTFETPFELIAAQGRSAQAISYTTDEHRASVEQFLKPKS
ncbi:MAG TPA: enoyl-CoA hydratase/isomerase family protein [Trebonia sp.]